jgi:pimeloyl-ACP methyl ester carboxylesterase
MSPEVPYSALQDDLYYPCRHAKFFSFGSPQSEAAMCAEMARLTYCRQDSSFAFNQDKIRDVLDRVGFKKCDFFENLKGPRGEGAHCFLAQREDAQKDKNLAIVAFRGTDKDDPTDVGFDTDFALEPWPNGGRVHTGFANALADVREPLNSKLHSVEGRILFTGHSLGAAMATLFASERPPSALYTFGSPRVGNANFIASLQGVDNHRYVDCCDIVTRIPLESMGYAHFGKPYYIDRKRGITFNPNFLFMWYDRFRAALGYLEDYALKPGNVGVRDFADHAPVNYVMPVTANALALLTSARRPTAAPTGN